MGKGLRQAQIVTAYYAMAVVKFVPARARAIVKRQSQFKRYREEATIEMVADDVFIKSEPRPT
jgi:hypothetical protein